MWILCRAQNQEAEGNKPVRYTGFPSRPIRLEFFIKHFFSIKPLSILDPFDHRTGGDQGVERVRTPLRKFFFKMC